MKRIYFHIDNPELIAWIKTRPTDSYRILIGSDTPEDVVDVVFAKVTKEGHALAQWVVEKIDAGELQIRVAPKVELPQGKVLDESIN